MASSIMKKKFNLIKTLLSNLIKNKKIQMIFKTEIRIQPCQGLHTVQIFKAAQAITIVLTNYGDDKSLPILLLILRLRKMMLQEVIPTPHPRSIILEVHPWPLLKRRRYELLRASLHCLVVFLSSK